jgi:hypothetical protein
VSVPTCAGVTRGADERVSVLAGARPVRRFTTLVLLLESIGALEDLG